MGVSHSKVFFWLQEVVMRDEKFQENLCVYVCGNNTRGNLRNCCWNKPFPLVKRQRYQKEQSKLGFQAPRFMTRTVSITRAISSHGGLHWRNLWMCEEDPSAWNLKEGRGFEELASSCLAQALRKAITAINLLSSAGASVILKLQLLCCSRPWFFLPKQKLMPEQMKSSCLREMDTEWLRRKRYWASVAVVMASPAFPFFYLTECSSVKAALEIVLTALVKDSCGIKYHVSAIACYNCYSLRD